MTRRSAPDAEDAHERIFRESQRAADTIFSHYQLSQLLATHAQPASMAQAVLDELVHVCESAGGAIWLTRDATGPKLVARAGEIHPPNSPNEILGDAWVRVDLEDIGSVALATSDERPIDAGARRFLSLVRHELAIALRGALLREALEGERAELAAVIHGASDAIVLVDPDHRVTRLNPAAERMLRRAAATVIGESCERALRCPSTGSPPWPCGGRCPFGRVLRSGESIDGHERTITTPTGESTVVVGSYATISRDIDERPHAVGILRDTTELARLAELRRGFLGSVSHELRTPIALIRGYVETLLHLDPDRETAQHYLARIDDAANRLGLMVAQILDASALAADEFELTLSRVDVATLLTEAASDVGVRFPGTEVELRVADRLPLIVADGERLRQVVDNLLVNAAKYAQGERAIEIHAGAARGTVTIRIEDRGIGIPAAERELVFEQFHRASNVRERNLPGSGLGLSISRRVVEAHGGSISFDPDRAEGSAVVVRLPIAGVADPAPTAVAPELAGIPARGDA